MKVNIDAHTAGNGYWSRTDKLVKIFKLATSPYFSPEFNYNELRAYFTKRSWDVEKYGLIYTDKLWLKEFKQGLKDLGFSPQAMSWPAIFAASMNSRTVLALRVP